MLADMRRVLLKYKGKAVTYRGDTFILLDAYYKKRGTIEVFGKVIDDVECVAQLFTPGTNFCREVSALDVRPTFKKWDYINKAWVNTFEQMAIAE